MSGAFGESFASVDLKKNRFEDRLIYRLAQHRTICPNARFPHIISVFIRLRPRGIKARQP